MLELNTAPVITLAPVSMALNITFAKPAPKAEPAEEFRLMPMLSPYAITLDGIVEE